MQLIEHRYPPQVKILNDSYLSHLTTRLSGSDCAQPTFNQLIQKVYQQLFVHVLNAEFPKQQKTFATRMTDLHKDVVLHAEVFDRDQKAVTVDVARAGMLPSQLFFDELNQVLEPHNIRQDHIFASRITNDRGEVTHTEMYESKIGGPVDDAIVIIPDPMGATGNSLCEVIKHYKEKVPGRAAKFIAVHMMITPEYIKNVTETHPDVQIYTARLDRGFSSKKALQAAPGTHWSEEKGLNDNQYIVPGAGGVGELINNSFV